MEWRVSWAALWAKLIDEKPTPNTMAVPKNKQIKPDITRSETETWPFITDVVMTPSVRPFFYR